MDQKQNKITLQLIKGKINLFRQEKETKAIKDRILKYIKNLFEHDKEEENYYKPVRVIDFWSNNYIEYKSNGDKNKALSVEEYLKVALGFRYGKKHFVKIVASLVTVLFKMIYIY